MWDDDRTCEQCAELKPDLRQHKTRLEQLKPDVVTDENIYSYHYVLEGLRWIEDCAGQEQNEDGSCPVGKTCHGDWGPCECGCNQMLSVGDDCSCHLCDIRAQLVSS